MRTFILEGIVLRRFISGETDRIITVFTKQKGKLKIRAKGVRKITSKRSPHVELFNHVILTLNQTSSLPILTEAQTIQTFSYLKDDLKKIGAAYYLCEIIDSLCPENQEHYQIFLTLQETLLNLKIEANTKQVIKEFEIKILRELGYLSSATLQANFDSVYMIEDLIERKLKTRLLLPHFYY